MSGDGSDLEPLREPETEHLTELELRQRERERRMPWVRLVILGLALVGLLIFWGRISDGMAGCFGKYVELDRQATSRGADAVEAPAADPPSNIQIQPARPLSPATNDAAP